MKKDTVELTIVAEINEPKLNRILAPRHEIAVADFENGDKISMCATMSGSITFEFGDGSYYLITAEELFGKVIDYREFSKQ